MVAEAVAQTMAGMASPITKIIIGILQGKSYDSLKSAYEATKNDGRGT